MKRTKIFLTLALCLTVMFSVAGCGSKHPRNEKSLIREAERVSYGDVEVIDYSYDDSGDRPSSSITVEDGEYGFEYEVVSKVGNAPGLDGTTLFNPLTNESVKKVFTSNDFYLNYIKYFFKYYKKDIKKLEKKYDVEIPVPDYESPDVKYFIIVFGCPDEDVAQDVFDELNEMLEEYDSRDYFKKTEKEGLTTSNGYRIGFFSEEFDDDRVKEGIYIPSESDCDYCDSLKLDWY